MLVVVAAAICEFDDNNDGCCAICADCDTVVVGVGVDGVTTADCLFNSPIDV